MTDFRIWHIRSYVEILPWFQLASEFEGISINRCIDYISTNWLYVRWPARAHQTRGTTISDLIPNLIECSKPKRRLLSAGTKPTNYAPDTIVPIPRWRSALWHQSQMWTSRLLFTFSINQYKTCFNKR